MREPPVRAGALLLLLLSPTIAHCHTLSLPRPGLSVCDGVMPHAGPGCWSSRREGV